MDDMQAIEQRITRELLRRAGPSEPVDDAVIFTAIAATQSPRWRFGSMLSATKFVVAGAIVALFGGFLLAGVLTTQPGEDAQPVVGASPSATPTLDIRELEWAPLELDEATFGPGARLVAVAASDSMIIVGGSVDGSAAVWTSADRMNWDRVPHDEEVFGGPADQEIKAIVPWRDGFVAAGEVGGISDGGALRVAMVWVSEDGTTWTRVPHDEEIFGGWGRQEMFDIAATDDRIVIVGFDEEGGDDPNEQGAVWTSIDGLVWEHDVFGGVMHAVEGTPDGFVGGDMWKSSDGLRWEHTELGDLRLGRVSALTQTPGGLVGVGSDVGDRPAAWTSVDGATWAPATIDAPMADGEVWGPNGVAFADSGLAATAGPGDTGGESRVLVSADGRAWTQGNTSADVADACLGGIASFGSHFVAIGPGSTKCGAPSSIWTTFEPQAPTRDVEAPVATPVVTDVIDLGGPVSDLTVAGDALWVAGQEGTVSVIDMITRDVTDTISVGDGDLRLVPSASDLWVVDPNRGDVTRISLWSRSVTDDYGVGEYAASVVRPVVADGSLFVWAESPSELVEIDLDSGDILDRTSARPAWWAVVVDDAIWSWDSEGNFERFDLDERVVSDEIRVAGRKTDACCVATEDAIWLVHHEGHVQRLDLATHEVTDTLRPGGGLIPGIAAAGAIWVPSWPSWDTDAPVEDGVVYRIDPVTREVTDAIPVGGWPYQPAFAEGAIWVPNAADGTVSRIDTATSEVTHVVDVGGHPRTPVGLDGAIWVPDHSVGTLTRIAIAEARVSETDDELTTPAASDLLPGVELVTEEVEPGVFWVLSDGTHDLEAVGGVVVAPGGDVWVTRQRLLENREENGPAFDSDVIRLGQPEGSLHDRGSNQWRLRVSDDGAPMLTSFGPIAGFETRASVFRDGAWAAHQEQQRPAEEDSPCTGLTFPPPDRLVVGDECWANGLDRGAVWRYPFGDEGPVPATDFGLAEDQIVPWLEAEEGGTGWASVSGPVEEDLPEFQGLARYDGEAWTYVPYIPAHEADGSEGDGPVLRGNHPVVLASTPDGTVWVGFGGDDQLLDVAHWDGATWSVYGPVPIRDDWRGETHFRPNAVFFLDGAVVFDGSSLRSTERYGGFGLDLAFDERGNVWKTDEGRLYVVTPKAVAVAQ